MPQETAKVELRECYGDIQNLRRKLRDLGKHSDPNERNPSEKKFNSRLVAPSVAVTLGWRWVHAGSIRTRSESRDPLCTPDWGPTRALSPRISWSGISQRV